MSYVVIARRWRPQQFDEIIAQEHVSRTLSNAIENKRIAHAYIFTGPRGIGKTTTARILAKALNCEKGPTARPCNECPSCKSITLGNSLDVLEIDGASNRGIDEIRNLRENIRFTPSLGKYRIYIIDEVHMLTKEAFNALLKTLEEPPAHALFIFATTEIHKVPATILSRCQRFDFKRIPVRTIMEHLSHICQQDNIEISEEALLQIAKKADGSMRDAQSILDQIISFSGNSIKFEHVAQALGVIEQDQFFRISDLVAAGNLKEMILFCQEIINTGYDLTEFLLGLEEHFRNILIAMSTGSTNLIDVSENYLKRYEEVVSSFSEADVITHLKIISETILAVKNSQQPQLKFELGLIKLVKLPLTSDIQSILEKLEILKKKADFDRVAEQDEVRYSSDSANTSDASREPDIVTLREQWPAVIQSISTKKAMLGTIMERSVPQTLQERFLHIQVKEVDAFQQELIQKNKAFIEQELNEISGVELKLKIDFLGGVASSVKKEWLTREEKEKKIKEMRSESELVARLIDDFDLELI